MKNLFRSEALAILLAGGSACALAGENAAPAPAAKSATTVYRQVMPDGRVVYADKLLKGARLDQTLTVEQPIKGNLWTTESGARPAIAPQVESTPVQRVNTIPAPGNRRTVEEATSDVIRAEMLLEDAKKRQQAGSAPLPGERGGADASYEARQKSLAREVADVQAAFDRALAQRDALRNGR